MKWLSVAQHLQVDTGDHPQRNNQYDLYDSDHENRLVRSKPIKHTIIKPKTERHGHRKRYQPRILAFEFTICALTTHDIRYSPSPTCGVVKAS